MLLGYGADAICPYLVYESIGLVISLGLLENPMTEEQIFENYMAACARGISKVMAKMGISTLQSYKVLYRIKDTVLLVSCMHVVYCVRDCIIYEVLYLLQDHISMIWLLLPVLYLFSLCNWWSNNNF